MSLTKRVVVLSVTLLLFTTLVGCGKSKSGSSSATTAASNTTVAAASLTVSSFTPDFSAMASLKALAAKGKGKIGVLLPDTASSARYVAFDAPLLTRAFTAAGLTANDFKIDNAQASATTMQQQADADITEGASVLLIDQLDSGSSAAIQKNAAAHGVKVIDYDRLTKGGVADRFYVSFDNVTVGKLIGQGLVDCVTAWNVASPQVLEMDGDPTDNNAVLFAQGYNSVLQPKFDNKAYVKVAEPGGTWDNQKALTLFEQQYTAHPNINAVVTANDGLGQSVISALKTKNIPAKKIPVTGQDATVQGLQNVLAGYQCGSVYKSISVEAQAAVSMALFLRGGETPPSGLVNGTTKDTTANADVKSVLLTPVWVTSANIESTVIKDNFVKASDICPAALASACTAAKIS
jgi:D-xylose transport system substrate-binding protein